MNCPSVPEKQNASTKVFHDDTFENEIGFLKSFIKRQSIRTNDDEMEGLDVKLTTTTDFVQNTDNVNLTLKFIFSESSLGVLYDTNFVEVIVPKIRQVISDTLDEFETIHTIRQLRDALTTNTSNTSNTSTALKEPQPAPVPPVENRMGQLRRVTFPHHFQDVTCGLCRAPFVQNEFYRTTPVCKHTFHKRCIDRWVLTNNDTCPTCL
jgi:hypothetical protein